jgi:hypothetical protein
MRKQISAEFAHESRIHAAGDRAIEVGLGERLGELA